MAVILQPDTANSGCTFSENMCTCCQAWPDMQSDRKNQLGKKRRGQSAKQKEWVEREEWDTDRIRCECRNRSESTYLELWGSVQTLPTTAQSTCRPGAAALFMQATRLINSLVSSRASRAGWDRLRWKGECGQVNDHANRAGSTSPERVEEERVSESIELM